jgi:hypothetical protein
LEIQIYLLLRNSQSASDETTATELDISVDINQDQDYQHGEGPQLSDENEESNNYFAHDQVYTPRNGSMNGVTGTTNHTVRPAASGTGTSASTAVVCDPTPLAEIIGWGRNTAFLFDPSRDPSKFNKTTSSNASSTPSGSKTTEHDRDYVRYHPMNIPIPPSINLERIMMIACSQRHVIILTHNGSLYSCGDNTEGALGLGDTFSRQRFTLVVWPADKNPTSVESENERVVTETTESQEEVGGREGEGAIAAARSPRPTVNMLDKQLNKGNSFKRIVSIATGSSDIGSHSMAIDEEGSLYGWGTPCATGHGKVQPVLTPLIVNMPLGGMTTETNPQPQTTPPISLSTVKKMKVKQVACGGGFTVAILSSGQVASWGTWAHGRLGLGTPPQSELNRGAGARRNKEKKKVVRYQLKPKIIPRMGTAVKVWPIHD